MMSYHESIADKWHPCNEQLFAEAAKVFQVVLMADNIDRISACLFDDFLLFGGRHSDILPTVTRKNAKQTGWREQMVLS